MPTPGKIVNGVTIFPSVRLANVLTGTTPIREIDFADKQDKAKHDKMVKLVEQMLALHEQAPAARTPQERTAIDRQIAATDAQIDRLVYDLYGLTEEEIKIVEGK